MLTVHRYGVPQQFRLDEDVDIKLVPDGEGYYVGWTNGGEFLRYTVDVQMDGEDKTLMRTRWSMFWRGPLMQSGPNLPFFDKTSPGCKTLVSLFFSLPIFLRFPIIRQTTNQMNACKGFPGF